MACEGDPHLSTVGWSQAPTWASQGAGSKGVPSPFITPSEDRREGDTFPQGCFIKGSFPCTAEGSRGCCFLWQGGDTSGKLSLQVLCNANEVQVEFLLLFRGFFVVFFLFFPSPLPCQRLARERLLEDTIKKPVVVCLEGSVFAFTSCWRELLCCCQQINKIRALF